jgi:Domain of unknown function (DUF4390)
VKTLLKKNGDSISGHIREALLCFFVILAVICPTTSVFSSEIAAVSVKQVNSEIFVTTALQPDQKFIEDLNNGLSKEIVFYIDLFRHWKLWPDEFVLGQKIVRILQIDPIKRECIGTNIEGNVKTLKRFKDLDSMIAWAANIADLKLTNVKVLEPDDYYVKVTVESNLKKLPAVVGYLLFFVPSKEFNISKDSSAFKIPSLQVSR